MTREEILSFCRRARDVGAVKHEEFADYVVALQQRKKIDDEWTTVETPYMAVDGKLAMANEDHRRQGKRLDFGAPQVLVDNADQLTLLVTVTSEIYGVRHGIATSRRIGGSAAERDFPWEVAETSAIGRSLSSMGYGLFPGSGLASAEDMLRSNEPSRPQRSYGREDERREPGRETGIDRKRGAERSVAREGGNGEGPVYSRPRSPATAEAQVNPEPAIAVRSGAGRSPLSAVQRRKLIELYHVLHGGNEAEATRGVDALFVEVFKHGMSEATYDEGSHITAQLLALLKSGGLAAQRAR